MNVLAVMDDAHRVIAADIEYGEHSLDYYQLAARLPEARAAVAEFIEATTDYHEALGKYESAERMYGENSNCKPMKEARGRALRAVRRFRAALTGVQA